MRPPANIAHAAQRCLGFERVENCCCSIGGAQSPYGSTLAGSRCPGFFRAPGSAPVAALTLADRRLRRCERRGLHRLRPSQSRAVLCDADSDAPSYAACCSRRDTRCSPPTGAHGSGAPGQEVHQAHHRPSLVRTPPRRSRSPAGLLASRPSARRSCRLEPATAHTACRGSRRSRPRRSSVRNCLRRS